ncbi:ABC transporter permease [Ramlibacter sp.]|uniref:ABC transporter permease n=1 Tax=Ramlibacter sp. TaxID=1917967 RepID=UPI0026337886|nr:ABC transporter permease [Ramlibacter sp.]MDB5954784.1 nitrate/sulfonate/bicarbonate family transporter, inner rane subunit [Ramlibacter sp.]
MRFPSILVHLYRRLERSIVPVALLIGWEIFSRSGILPPALLPAPSQVLRAWADWVVGTDGNTQTYSAHWLYDTAASAGRVFAGFGLATFFGVTLGMAIGWSRTIEKLIEPVLQVLRPVPPVSWIPLAIIWFGIANKPAIFLVFLGSFFPVLLSTIHGVKTCDRNLLRAGAMTGGTPHKLLRHIVFPAALPSIFSGLRIAIGSAWMLTVTAEMVAVKSGVGYVLWDSYYFLRYDIVIAAMASIGLLGFLSDFAIKRVAARVLRWQHGSTLQAREA